MTGHRIPAGKFAAFLFDMDGTLLNSIAVANRIWGEWAERHGIDAAEVIRVLHGVRVIETVRRFATPGMDIEQEAASITAAEVADVDGVKEIPGARAFLERLPRGRWAIVTSAPRALALRRIEAASLPIPDVLIAAEDVTRGKPAPDGFLAAAKALGVDAAHCLIWEDAPAGIAAAEAAGGTVIVVESTHPSHGTNAAGFHVQDYRSVRPEVAPDGTLNLVEERSPAKAGGQPQ